MLIVLVCGAYLVHRSSLVFGLTLIVASLFDALDGAVARCRNMETKAGGYFDAIADRYQELAVLCAIGWVTGLWPLAMLGFAGGVLTSYAKARAALEIPVSNRRWPDLFERAERSAYLCTLLVLAGLPEVFGLSPDRFLAGGLALFALLTNVTALQRIWRVVKMLKKVNGQTASAEAPNLPAFNGQDADRT
jgi:phosphatidylglycerophosphate synthase